MPGVKKPPAYIDVPLMVVVAMPYITAPLLPDFDYQSVPDSPPLAIIAAYSSFAAWDTVTDEGYDVRPLNMLKLPRSM